jgi:predicted small metal-binding protein
VAKQVNCPCGKTIRGETDDELVTNVEEHVRTDHPDQVGQPSREDILAMAEPG